MGELFMDTVKIGKNSTLIIAHRGLSGIECENTAAAFVAAGNRSYFGIETDVHRTADGKFIIIHDNTTERVSPEKVSVEESNYDVLRKVRLSDKEGRIREDLCLPSLEEYLRICRTYGKIGVLELKNSFEKSDVEKILKTVRNEYKIDKMIFISFDYNNLVYIRELEKKANLQYLCSCEVDGALIEKLLKYGLDLDINYRYLDESNIKLLHEKGIKVNCWTVDEKCHAERLIGLGVDFITTNILELRNRLPLHDGRCENRD